MAYQTIVVGLVPEAIAADVQAARTLIRSSYPSLPLHESRIPPHITVVEPVSYLLDDEDIERILAYPLVDSTVTLRGYALFANRGGNVVYQKCACPGLMATRGGILGMFPPLISLVNPTPTLHLTIVRPIPHSFASPVMTLLERTYQPAGKTFTIDRLSVFQRRTPTAAWEPVTSPLRSSSPSS